MMRSKRIVGTTLFILLITTMRSIIIERSKEAMQVAMVFKPNEGAKQKDVWAFANNMAHLKKLTDYDVMFFDTLEELNEFLLSNLKI